MRALLRLYSSRQRQRLPAVIAASAALGHVSNDGNSLARKVLWPRICRAECGPYRFVDDGQRRARVAEDVFDIPQRMA